MREIHGHEINDCNRAITITADEQDPDNGNASHRYEVTYVDKDWCSLGTAFDFQHGPIVEVGANGITHEALLAILIDRLECFQTGKFANPYNARALDLLRDALSTLNARTTERTSRGVEGTHEL